MDPLELAHLLRRTEYVVRPSRVTDLTPLSREQAVDNILAFSRNVALPGYLENDIEGEGYDQYVYAIQWWIDRMCDVARPMREKMTWFWHGHFCSGWDKVGSTRAMMQQNKLFRDQAMGNFRTLTHSMSLQTAMLVYLDNIDNVDSSPNQNFARELMELFTIGVGNYTEEDVTAAARAWTGHGIDWNNYEYQFHSGDHDYGNKTFMGVARNWNGPDIINYLLQENTAKKLVACKFLSRKLWQFFAHQLTAGVPADDDIVNDLAQVLYDNDFAIAPWVKAMLMDDRFYTTRAMQGLVRSPVDFVVACMHYTGMRSEQLNPQWSVDGMGQVPYVPPNVAGWKTNGYWINTSLFGARADFARGITWRMRNDDPANEYFAYYFDPSEGTEGNPAQAVNNVVAKFALDLSTITRQAMDDFVTQHRSQQSWIDWWEPTDLVTMAMMTPEFHVA